MNLKELKTGVCDFICHHCPIARKCAEHNHKDNDNVELNQVELRKVWAKNI